MSSGKKSKEPTLSGFPRAHGGLAPARRRNDNHLSEAQQRALWRAFPDWIFRLHRDGTYLDFEGHNEESLITRPSEFLGKKFTDVLPADIVSQLRRAIDLALKTQEPQSFESTFLHNGRPRDYETRVTVSGADEVIAIVRDITGRKCAEAIEAGQRRILEMIARGATADEVLEALVFFIESVSRGAACSVLLIDRTRGVLRHKMSPHLPAAFLEAIDGLPVAEGSGVCGTAAHRKEGIIVADVLSDPLTAPFRNLCARHGICACWSTPILSKTGEVLGTFAMYYKEIRQPAPHELDLMEISSRLAGIAIERHLAEQELLKASKLESIGLLAGGIAHDFNNILTAILGNLSLAKVSLDPQDRAWQYLEETEQATRRAKDLTHQLLTFARGGAPIRKPTALASLLHEGVSFALTGSPVECDLLIADDLWLADIDAGQINQVIHNLVLNARQAMPLGGKIIVSAENLCLQDDELIHGMCLSANRYIQITVADQGVGIPDEYLNKIFDPYFTTKQTGSGLGLATSYSIIKNHQGYIFTESRLDEGTTFTMYLPASEQSLSAPLCTSQEPVCVNGKILVMDDEDILRNLLTDMLDYLGYTCEAAKTGEEAVEMYQRAQEAGEPFQAVIVDLTVPGGMGGQETLSNLRELDADVKCVVSSGYSDDPVMAEYRHHGFVAVIAKPYQISQLGEVLQTVLSDS